jgi:hypothetical protein
MRKLMIALALLLPVSLHASEPNTYVALKLSYFELEDADIDESNFDDPDNVGLTVGLEKATDLGYIGLEAEATRTFLDGSYEGESVSVDTYGIYAVYRTRESSRVDTGPYIKVKAGPFHYRAHFDRTPDESATTGAFGIGVGINMAVVRFELEIIAPEKDIGLISLNLVF